MLKECLVIIVFMSNKVSLLFVVMRNELNLGLKE